MDKPKFKMTKEEMLHFNDDCFRAAGHSPHFRGWGPEDREILLGEISPKELVETWLCCATLFNAGYSECLSIDAEYTFEEYKKYKILKKAWKLLQKEKGQQK